MVNAVRVLFFGGGCRVNIGIRGCLEDIGTWTHWAPLTLGTAHQEGTPDHLRTAVFLRSD
jgi:hypothetical protein